MSGVRRAIWIASVTALLVAVAGLGGSAGSPKRVVSINPSLTSILVALGAGRVLVGVDDYSARQQPDVAHLSRVGGLHDTSLEAVAALGPDLVVLVPSVEQRDFRGGLERLGIPYRTFNPLRFDEVLDTIEELGDAVGYAEAAERRVAEIREVRRHIEARRGERPTARGVLVITRDPLFVVGPGSFIDEMLAVVGIENLGRDLEGAYPRATLEWLVAGAPELILDADGDAESAEAFWSRWPSLPAVEQGRVVSIPQGVATLPGPHLDRGLEMLARAARGESLGASP
jgi:iron complex transport system substrate-binding protein